MNAPAPHTENFVGRCMVVHGSTRSAGWGVVSFEHLNGGSTDSQAQVIHERVFYSEVVLTTLGVGVLGDLG